MTDPRSDQRLAHYISASLVVVDAGTVIDKSFLILTTALDVVIRGMVADPILLAKFVD